MFIFKLIYKKNQGNIITKKKKGYGDCNHDTVIMGKGNTDNIYSQSVSLSQGHRTFVRVIDDNLSIFLIRVFNIQHVTCII